jgi:endonuclease YncB( thermonuclease family)
MPNTKHQRSDLRGYHLIRLAWWTLVAVGVVAAIVLIVMLALACAYDIPDPDGFPPPPPPPMPPRRALSLAAPQPIEARPLTDRLESYHVYDGDTLTQCTIDLGYGVVLRDSIRIVGIDCPEVTGDHKEAGIVVRDAAWGWLVKHHKQNNRELWLIGTGRGKYGRILGDVQPLGVGQTLGQWLLEKGYAKPTGKGGKREPWTEEELERIITP